LPLERVDLSENTKNGVGFEDPPPKILRQSLLLFVTMRARKTRFKDRIALVTGAASGIGLALSEQLSAEGATVVMTDINAELCASAAHRITGAESVGLDVTDAGAVQAAVDDVVARHGRLDLIFNNAGIATAGEVRHMTLDQWRTIFDVNVNGVIHGIQAAYPHMLRQGSGHIVNTASMAGLVPAPGLTAYAGTKHAVAGISTSLRLEAAQLGVRVSAVCPGLIRTNLLRTATLINEEGLDVERDELWDLLPPGPATPDFCATEILNGVVKNRALIVITPFAKTMWRMYRTSPEVMLTLTKGLFGRIWSRVVAH